MNHWSFCCGVWIYWEISARNHKQGHNLRKRCGVQAHPNKLHHTSQAFFFFNSSEEQEAWPGFFAGALKRMWNERAPAEKEHCMPLAILNQRNLNGGKNACRLRGRSKAGMLARYSHGTRMYMSRNYEGRRQCFKTITVLLDVLLICLAAADLFFFPQNSHSKK